MSLTEYDREVLLQEIQQIKFALESTSGCQFNASSESDESYESDDDKSNLKGFPENTHEISEQSRHEAEQVWKESSEEHSNVSKNNFLEEVKNILNKPVSSLDETKYSEKGDFLSFNVGKEQSSLSCMQNSETDELSNVSSNNSSQNIATANIYVEKIFKGYQAHKAESLFQSSPSIKKGQIVLNCSASLSTLENTLQVNRQYQNVLIEELKKVDLALKRNRHVQDELSNFDEGIQTSDGLSKACIGKFSNPYFKDGTALGPPDNEDTKEKKAAALWTPSFTKPSKPWKKKETILLEDGVYNNNLEKMLAPLMEKLKKIEKENKECVKNGRPKLDKSIRAKVMAEIKEIKEIPRAELLKDSSDIDFFKISKNYLPARDEFELQLHWCNVLHPSINQSKFTKEEDSKIIKLAKKYENCEWEKIAKEIGTNRTPVQCLQRFQRTLNKDMIKTKWDESDDLKLKEAVALYGPKWVFVAEYMGNRTTNQCMFRWEKSINPSIKRGKWSVEEDNNLIEAVKKHGLGNWKEVKLHVPGRTDAQCRERYVSSLDPQIKFGDFTPEEDKKIIELVEKYGVGKWSTIAKEMAPRLDCQIARRYRQIKRGEYHEYRKSVLWKKNSVLGYFLHRDDEKRDYSIEELDVNFSPSLNPQEKKRLMRKKALLIEEGYSEEELTRKLAQMHYKGEFAVPISLGRPKNTSNSYKPKNEDGLKSPKYELRSKTFSHNELNEDSCVNDFNKPAMSEQKYNANECQGVSVTVNMSNRREFSSEKILNRSSESGYSEELSADDANDADYKSPSKNVQNKLNVKKSPTSSDSELLIDKVTEVIAGSNESSELVYNKNEIDLINRLQEKYNEARRRAKIKKTEKLTGVQKHENNEEPIFKSNDDKRIFKCEELLQQCELKQKEFRVVNKIIQVHIKKLEKNDLNMSSIENIKSKLNMLKELQVGGDSDNKVDTANKKKRRKRVSKTKCNDAKRLKIITHIKTEHDEELTAINEEANFEQNSVIPENNFAGNIISTKNRTTNETSQIIQDDTPKVLPEANNPLQIFTRLLSGFHIDTSGVMQSLPHNESKIFLQSDEYISDCYPLSPSLPSLRGIRTLLLNRRILSNKVNSAFPKDSPFHEDKSYRQTRTYDALKKRFKSMFIWPTFLATFIPKYTEYSIQPDLTVPICFVSLSPTISIKTATQLSENQELIPSCHNQNITPLKDIQGTKKIILTMSSSTAVPCFSFNKKSRDFCERSIASSPKKLDKVTVPSVEKDVNQKLSPLKSIKVEEVYDS
ncbi:uncharacterized protein LOC105845985 isoform X1 [Hydra vulgaris]|nr:uncharacterized protein LOC105845985 [Hydra vulgaris]